jgi:hypothetical protein
MKQLIGIAAVAAHSACSSGTSIRVSDADDGCAEQNYSLRRNERPDVGAIVGAYYLAVPILWLTQYKDHHAYEFDCLPETRD